MRRKCPESANGAVPEFTEHGNVASVIVYAVVDDALSPDFPLGVEVESFIRREDAERFVEEVRDDEPEIASNLRIEERELDVDVRSLHRR